ncbi:MAG: 50S ribosomal protein L11 methyltransferase, partial [Trueperaceae bacterium]|nr:50S ribosomal protein L11 methyltransferase [Trueperaceae bacterium]
MKAYRLPGAAREPERLEGAEGAVLWDAGATSIAVDGDDVVAYFEAPATGHLPADGAWEDIDEVDHVAAYHAGLQAVAVGPLVVAPTHREVTLQPGQTVVWLDPGMAFGTGHHETTRLALAALARLDLAIVEIGRHERPDAFDLQSNGFAPVDEHLGAAGSLGVIG